MIHVSSNGQYILNQFLPAAKVAKKSVV